MKKRTYICIAIAFAFNFSIKAQTNLVPNPSFENYSTCPASPDNMSDAVGWFAARYSPDYFNNCANVTTPSMSVPKNFGGFQQPATGNAYAGFASYSSYPFNYREYLGNTLISPLNIGVKYFLSFKVCLSVNASFSSNTPNCATNNLGAKFSSTLFDAATIPAVISNTATIYNNTIVTDSVNWTRITGSFIADSAYQYVLIGNFFNDFNTQIIKYGNNLDTLSYYFIDDVCLSTDSNFVANYIPTGFHLNESDKPYIKVFPNPVKDFIFIDNNSSIDIEISNIIGEIIFESHNFKETMLDIRQFHSSVFYLKIKSNNDIYTYKLIKQ